MAKTLRAPAELTTNTVLAIEFVPDPGKEKTESKNYDIIPRTANDDKKTPLLIGANGLLYIQKGILDPKKVKRVTVQVVVETEA